MSLDLLEFLVLPDQRELQVQPGYKDFVDYRVRRLDLLVHPFYYRMLD